MLFSELAEYLKRIEETPSRLDMTDILVELFRAMSKEGPKKDIGKLIYVLQGRISPAFTGVELGVGERYIVESISLASGYTVKQVDAQFRKSGDLGDTAEHFLSGKRQSAFMFEELTLDSAYDAFIKIATTSGIGSQQGKIKKVAELFTRTSPLGAKYIARFVNGRLRLGVGDPTILDAFSMYMQGTKEKRVEVERAYNLCSDLGLVADTVMNHPEKLKNFKPAVFSPIRPALAERLPTAKDIFDKIGPCYVDSKYDGLRMQIHRKNDKVEIYSRRLEKITNMFPDVVKAALALPSKEFILDCEALAYNRKEKRYYSFQETMQRKRKYGIKEAAEELPLYVFAFDLLYKDGEDCTNMPYKERREMLEKFIGTKNERIKVSEQKFAKTAKDLQKYFDEAIRQNLEGIIAKDPASRYVAGAREFAWIKLKKSYAGGEVSDTFDVVILGYYRGKGIRTQFKFGGLLCGVYNPDRDVFETLARVGGGFTEEEMKQFEEMLSKITIKEKPKNVDAEIKPDYWVELKYVIAVTADEITLSPTHTCNKLANPSGKGFALRFPRMVMFRPDRDVYSSTTSKEIQEMFDSFRKKGRK